MATLINHSLWLGIGATIIMDIYALALMRILRISGLDYALVGRWVGHLFNGRMFHTSISRSPPIRFESLIGWGLHYCIGVLFAGMFLCLSSPDWLRDPSLSSALVFGVVTVIAPFGLLQPAMGAGIAASKTPKPNTARMKSVSAHLIFGFGLWLAAWLANIF